LFALFVGKWRKKTFHNRSPINIKVLVIVLYY